MLRVRLGCETPKAAPTWDVIPSQSGFPLVGVTGFEPATSSSRTTRATKLRHTPWLHAGPVGLARKYRYYREHRAAAKAAVKCN